jgi:hypothetical protein
MGQFWQNQPRKSGNFMKIFLRKIILPLKSNGLAATKVQGISDTAWRSVFIGRKILGRKISRQKNEAGTLRKDGSG